MTTYSEHVRFPTLRVRATDHSLISEEWSGNQKQRNLKVIRLQQAGHTTRNQ